MFGVDAVLSCVLPELLEGFLQLLSSVGDAAIQAHTFLYVKCPAGPSNDCYQFPSDIASTVFSVVSQLY